MAGAAACPGDDVGDSESDGAALFSFLQIVFVFVAFNYDSSGAAQRWRRRERRSLTFELRRSATAAASA